MHIEKISYQKTFNLGNYSSERIGVEFVLNQGESADKALDIAKELVHEYHAKSQIDVIPNFDFMNECSIESPAKIVKKETPKSVVENAKNFIDSCVTVQELKAWELMSKTKPELLEYYNNKLKMLTND